MRARLCQWGLKQSETKSIDVLLRNEKHGNSIDKDDENPAKKKERKGAAYGEAHGFQMRVRVWRGRKA